MQITTLPEDLNLDPSAEIALYPYRTAYNLQKSKINLAKNTISFLRVGTKEVVGDDAATKIDNAHFLIMKSGNCLMTEKVSEENRVYESILLFFSDEVAIDFLERNDLTKVKASQEKSFYTFAYDGFIQHFVDGLENVIRLSPSIQSKVLTAKFEEIMLYLTHHHGSAFLSDLIHKMDDKTARLIKVVEHNRHVKLSLDELAFLSRMSISTFKRSFYDHYGSTPMKWFSAARLNHAALLLKTNQKRAIDLYEDAGYESLSNFIQAFKRQFGQTPKQYQHSI
ncbi:MAG: AraC family transcriptional regulator [Bacteroidota bacterium]